MISLPKYWKWSSSNSVVFLTTGSRQPNMAPKISILPILTFTGSAARCWPRGVSFGSVSSQAPIFRSKFIALLMTWSWGGSKALERKSSGEPRLHFCRLKTSESLQEPKRSGWNCELREILSKEDRCLSKHPLLFNDWLCARACTRVNW